MSEPQPFTDDELAQARNAPLGWTARRWLATVDALQAALAARHVDNLVARLPEGPPCNCPSAKFCHGGVMKAYIVRAQPCRQYDDRFGWAAAGSATPTDAPHD